MTENKRFEGEEDSDYIRDNKTDERALYLCDWLNKLNNLSDENSQLKERIKELQHKLDSLSGLYVADNKEFKHYWRLE